MTEVSTITKVNFFRGYGIYTAGAYAARLISASSLRPFVTHDIVTRSGDLLAVSGSAFTGETYLSLQNQHLKQPFDACVAIEKALNPFELQLDFQQIIQSDDFLFNLIEQGQLQGAIDARCKLLSQHPLLQQKLSVMKLQEYALYQRTLYTSLLAMLIAREMRLPILDCEYAVCAGLYHDIGLLHIEPHLLQQSQDLTAADLLQFHAHVRITQALIAFEGVLAVEVIDAVLDHQERCDGTGYPNGKVESEMSLLGQILGLADSAVAIYLKRMRPQGRGWHDVAGVIALSRPAYHFRAVDILQSLVARSQLPVANVISGADVFGFSQKVLVQCASLQRWFEGLRMHLLGIGYVHGDRHFHALQNAVLHIAIAYKSVLVFDGEKTLSSEDVGVEDLHLMAQELAYHVRRLTLMVKTYAEESAPRDPALKAAVDHCLAHVGVFLSD